MGRLKAETERVASTAETLFTSRSAVESELAKARAVFDDERRKLAATAKSDIGLILLF